MKIALIDPSHYTTNYGLRCISSYLLSNHFETKLFFLSPDLTDGMNWGDWGYPQEIYEELARLITDCDIIAFSVFSSYYHSAAALSDFLKREFPEKLVIWGGIHATVSPDTSILHCDIVCLGEGEETMLEIAKAVKNKEPLRDIMGIWIKTEEGVVIKNDVRPLEQNLDKYPYQDYDINHMFIIKDAHIRPGTEKIMKDLLTMGSTLQHYFGLKTSENYQYLTMTSRGCPNHCAYCCNNHYHKIYKGKGTFLRTRSIEHIIGELEEITRHNNFINFISFFDDDFTARPLEFIKQFCEQYKSSINLPFKCNLNANTISREKISLLSEAGLISIEIGLQSGSENVQKNCYKRPFNAKLFKKNTQMLAEFPHIVKYYDIILDNPYESELDIAKTITFLAEMPKPYNISSFSLTFFPGTELYARALNDSLIDLKSDPYLKFKRNNILYPEKSYSKILIYLAGRTPPVLKHGYLILAHPWLIRLLSQGRINTIFQKILKTRGFL
ncbi:MAG: radical SAM protein [Methanoregula sp.]|nr:radical SAM protein [Methanoregula sp.]